MQQRVRPTREDDRNALITTMPLKRKRIISSARSPKVVLLVSVLTVIVYVYTQAWHSVSSKNHYHHNTSSSSSTSHQAVSSPRNLPATTTNTTQTSSQNTITVAYVVTITGCGTPMRDEEPFPITEGAAVLQHSIQRQSSTNYNYQMYALYHPDAYACAQTLQPYGYRLLERNVLVSVEDIQGEFLRTHITKNGCCGEKELLKLEAYTLVQHEIVVLLDLDTLLLQPLDPLFDILLQRTDASFSTEQLRHLFMVHDKEEEHETRKILKSGNLQVMHTMDYAMVPPSRKIKPFQGGFVILRPNQAVYDEFVQIVKEGDFRDRGGWGGQTGKFWGGQTFQGIMPYYYHILHPGQSIALNWCTFNNMGSPSRNDGIVHDQPHGACYTGTDECEDCRARDISSVALVHYTVCQKPWLCMRHAADALENRLCRQFHHAWFRERSLMEQSWGRSGRGTGSFDTDHFLDIAQRSATRVIS